MNTRKSSNYKKFGKNNSKLVNFNINNLDNFELMQYDQFSNSMDKASALQILINNTEGDYSQLNKKLSVIAEEQHPSDEFFEDNRQYKNGGGIEKENAEMVLNNNKQISHHTKELASAVKGKKVPAWVVAKVNRSASDLSDATHYLDGSKFKNGGTMRGFTNDKIFTKGDVSVQRVGGSTTWNVAIKGNGVGRILGAQTYEYAIKKAEKEFKNKMAKGGYVFKGDKYEYVPTKFTYTIGGL